MFQSICSEHCTCAGSLDWHKQTKGIEVQLDGFQNGVRDFTAAEGCSGATCSVTSINSCLLQASGTQLQRDQHSCKDD